MLFLRNKIQDKKGGDVMKKIVTLLALLVFSAAPFLSGCESKKLQEENIQLKKQVETFANEKSVLETQVNELTTKNSELTSKVSELNARLDKKVKAKPKTTAKPKTAKKTTKKASAKVKK
ncbi:MAG TPA: hypothetical protein DD641_03755 [Deltaproteobacteria bacterium]|nr:hypothetical protein [Deltaproteobacteria bacterium]